MSVAEPQMEWAHCKFSRRYRKGRENRRTLQLSGRGPRVKTPGSHPSPRTRLGLITPTNANASVPGDGYYSRGLSKVAPLGQGKVGEGLTLISLVLGLIQAPGEELSAMVRRDSVAANSQDHLVTKTLGRMQRSKRQAELLSPIDQVRPHMVSQQ